MLFKPLPASTWAGPSSVSKTMPAVYRGLAAHWPAVQRWSLSGLARQVPDVPVKLVVGNREAGATHFVQATLAQYLLSLGAAEPLDTPLLYLKEFDVLRAAPALKQDLQHNTLFPPGGTTSLQSWIGPAGARTGLHFDYLDNFAVQVIGHKRFYLLRPGTVERLGAVSDKYDAWATLSTLSAEEVALANHHPTDDFFQVDLNPGDVLHVPASWWHEVMNLSPSVSFGGFYGSRLAVTSRWAWVSMRHTWHRLGGLNHGYCTCHAES
jgi:hypothetical protein